MVPKLEAIRNDPNPDWGPVYHVGAKWDLSFVGKGELASIAIVGMFDG